MPYLSLLPCAALLIILPIPGTVAGRLLLLLIAVGIALSQLLRTPATRVTIPALGWVAPWVAVSCFSLVYATDVAYSQRELLNEFGYTSAILISFFVLSNTAESRRFLLRALGAGLLLLCTWALFNWWRYGGSWNESAASGGSGTFSTYIVTVWPMLLWWREQAQSRLERRLALGALGFSFLLAILTLQRIVLPVLALQAAILFWGFKPGLLSHLNRRSLAAMALLVAIGVSGILAMQQVRYGSVADRAAHVSLGTDIRFEVWPKTLGNILEHPFSGAGFGRNAMRKAYSELIPQENTQVWHAHNLVLNQGISSGLPGMFAVLLAFFGLGRYFLGRVNDHSSHLPALAALAIVVGVLARNQFNDFFVRDLSLLFWALIGMSLRACKPTSEVSS